MSDYLDAGNQYRIYSEHGDCLDLLDKEFDYDKASARILGRDLGPAVDHLQSRDSGAGLITRNP